MRPGKPRTSPSLRSVLTPYSLLLASPHPDPSLPHHHHPAQRLPHDGPPSQQFGGSPLPPLFPQFELGLVSEALCASRPPRKASSSLCWGCENVSRKCFVQCECDLAHSYNFQKQT